MNPTRLERTDSLTFQQACGPAVILERSQRSAAAGIIATSVDSIDDALDSGGMINQCIRTRWGLNAAIDWNGAEPIY